LGNSQTLVHQYLSPNNDTYWVQRQTNPTATSGSVVTINDTAPMGDRYNLSIVEVRAPASTSTITSSGGTPQSTTVATLFGANLQATVKDGSNNPIAGSTVTFTAPGSGATGSFAGGVNTAVTNSSGIATAAAFTASTIAGGYTVIATAPGASTPANFLLTNTAGSPAAVSPTAGTPQSTTVSTPFATSMQATVKDSFGNAVAGVVVTFNAPTSGASGSFAGGVNTATTNASGVATAVQFTANAIAGTFTVTAGVSGATSASFTLTNNPPPPASISAAAGSPQSATINSAFATNLQATVRDASSNPVSGVTVTFSVPGAGASGTFTGPNTAVTDINGIATAGTLTANSTAGSYTVSASVSGVSTSASFNLTNTPGSANSLAATAGTPQSATIGTAFATSLQVTVKDVGNNGVLGVTITFTAPGSGASGTFANGVNTATTNSSGVATAQMFTANSTPGGPYSVTAGASGVAGTATFSLTNTTAQPATITSTSGTPQSATVNTAFGTLMKATVKDASNNPVSGATVTFSDPVSGPSGIFGGPTAVTTDSTGVAIAPSFTANSLAGSYTVTAMVTGVNTPASFNLTNTPGSPASVSATAGTPQSTTVNALFGIALQATVRDASSNPISGVPVTFAAPPSGASATFSGSATVTTNSSGIATAPTLTANGTAGSYTVTASVSGLTPASFNLTNNSASTGIKLLQTNVNGNESGTSNMSLAFTSNNVAGDFLIVTGTAARPASTITVSDSLGNTYLTAFGPVTDTAQDVTMYVWYVPVCKGGANTVTITPSGTAALEIHVSEWSGLATTSPVDKTASATGTGTAVSSGAVTPSMNGELIFGYGWVFNTASAGTGFTPLSLVNGDLDEYQVQSTAGSIAATFTQTSGTWFAAVVTFKPSGWSISGNLSGGAGSQVALSGASTATVTADTSGNYTFNGLNNGTYVVTPSGAAFDFDPFRQTVVVSSASLTGVNFTAGVATDWLMVDHDQSRTGYAFEENTLTASNVANLQLNWSKTLDGNITAQPLFVHNITISGQTRDILVVSTGGNSIYVLDASNGTVLWNRNFGAPTPNTWGIPDGFGIEAPPVIDRAANRIYTVSTDGSFRTISLLDGTDVYAALSLITNSDTNKVWGGLNKVNNNIYVVSASNGGDVAPWRGQLYQIDVSSTPALKGDFVVVPSIAAPSGGGGIWGYGGASADVVSGNVFITTSFDSNVSGNGNEQTAPYSDSVIALDKSANLLGYYQPPPPKSIPCFGAPCDLDFASTPLYFQPPGCPALITGGSKDGNLYLFRVADLIASGQPLQVLTLNAPQDSLGSGGVGGVPAYSPALNMVFIGDAGPGVTGISAGIVGLTVTSSCTLQVAWSNALGGSDTPNSTPTVANGIVFIGEGLTGLVHAYNAQTGLQLWQSPATYAAGATFAAPVVAGGKVYVGSWSSLSSGGGIVGAFSLPASTPILTVSPTSLTFTAVVGGSNPASSPINVTNTGAGTLSFTARSDSSWLTISPTSGTVPQTLQASASIAGLGIGTYTGHITITASGAQGSPATVTVTLNVTSSSGTSTLSIDTTIFKDNGTASTTIVSPALSTASANELLLAFIASDYQPSQSSTNVSVTGIAGGGLTWVLVQRANAQSGTAEIWRAFAPSKLTSVTVTATLSQSVQSSMTIVAFAGVDTTGTNGSGAIGAVIATNSSKGAPTGTVTTTRNNSWVVAAGDDYDNAISRTLGPGQTLIHQYLSPINDTYWSQRETNTTPVAGTAVTINDTAPTTDRFNLAIAEVLPAFTGSGSSSTSDMTITLTHSGSFRQGQTGATYTTTVTNVGSAASAGSVSVSDSLPVGLTATAISGANWNCTFSTLTCARNDAVAAGSSYPPITLTLNVASDAPSSVTNAAAVSGGGETNLANDNATSLTAIVSGNVPVHVAGAAAAPPVVSQTFSTTYTATAVNDAVVVLIGCRSPGVTSMSLAAPGWTFTPISGLVGPSSYYDYISTFGAIAPNTSSSTFTVTLTGGNGNCSSNDTTILIDEFSGNDTTGGTTTFEAHNESLDPLASGNCSGAPITPISNNDTIWYACYDNVTGVTNGYTKGQDDSTGDWSEYKILNGGAGVVQNPGFAINPNFFSFGLGGVAIKSASNYPGVFTYHNDNLRTGQNPKEVTLAPANVNSTEFGKLFSYSTDGTSYAAALYMANVNMGANGIHNVVYVATAHDSVYAFDADTPSANPLWKVSFLGTGVTTVPSGDTGDCCDQIPEIGITGTPVIDPNTGTIYVVAKTKETSGGNTTYVQRLHALDVATGAEKSSGPVVIQASVSGTGDGTSGGKVAFDALHENQRPALLLSNGVVYIGWAANYDVHPWHGWLIGYNASNVQQQIMAYNATANGYGGGIWQSGGGPGVDASGNIYFATGNGTFDANTGGADYADSVEKLSPSGTVLDYFTPHDQDNLNTNDLDLGSAGPVLLLDQSSGSYPHILISAGKGGTIYVINRDGMGHYNASNDSQIIQELAGVLPNGTSDSGNFSAPVFFNGYVYFGAVSDTVKAFQLSNGMLNTVPSSHTPETYQNRGGTFAISANGTSNGILWTVQDNGAGVPGILYAYDATNLATELYNSSQAGTRDTLDVATKFNIPIVANGKVFVVTKTTLTVFGLLP
jgi:hypothetical protein